MARCLALCVAGIALFGVVGGCSSPFGASGGLPRSFERSLPGGVDGDARFGFGGAGASAGSRRVALGADAGPDDYVRFALLRSPSVEAAYQRWVAASERLPQVGSLPDPRVSFGFFLDEVETRTGAQQARVGVGQGFPWPGLLGRREDAAAASARSAWRLFEAERLAVTERVVGGLHELAYVDAAIRITGENLELLRSFERVVRARYRVGTGSHPELTRVQVELGRLDDRLRRLRGMRPAYVAELNAVLNRSGDAEIPPLGELPGRVVSVGGGELAEIARASNPTLLSLDERIEEQRALGAVARLEGRPDFSVGVDYLVTDEAMDSSIAESGDDPILVSLGVSVPLWRGKYDAGVRESMARRLAVTHERAAEGNRISAAIRRSLFEHTDAHRRVRLYEGTLIPKAEESLRASLAGFRTGGVGFLDLLDTERTLLEFALAAERARADRGRALAELNRLVGRRVPTVPASEADDEVMR